MMRAYTLKRSGKPSVLKITDIPAPKPQENEVSVKMNYIGINYAEIMSRKGLYSWAPKRPYILGMEGSGIIEDVGEGVEKSRIGQEVMVAAQYGCYAENVVVPEQQAIPAFEGYSMQESAAFLVNYMTAWAALFELAKVQKDDKVLITAAAGGVGTAAIQLAASLGCAVYGMAGSQEKIDYIKSLGAAEGLNYREKDCFEQLKRETGGIDVVVEMVGGSVYKESFNLLNPLGRIAVIGFASLDFKLLNPLSWWRTLRDIPRVKMMDLAVKSGSVMASHLGYLLDDPQLMTAMFERMEGFIKQHDIKPQIGKVFPFEQADKAHEFIESRKSTGKVLLEI